MRIALAQINPTVGDLEGNSRRIVEFAARAIAQQADIVVFPELAIIGYPPKDLLLKPQFIDDNLSALQSIARQTRGIDVVVGYAERNAHAVGRPLHNAAALLRDGKIAGRHFKTLLPNYDVFDERRYFEPAPPDARHGIIQIGSKSAGITAGISICEDLWNDPSTTPQPLYDLNPIADQHAAGARLLINASASPFFVGKHELRLEMFASLARKFSLPLCYINQVGGNDELIFDGNSVAFDAAGNVIAQAKSFEEDLLIFDLTSPEGDEKEMGRIETPSTGIASLHDALVLGLHDYVRKCGFSSVVLGLSGGIDSAVTAALAVAALGADKVVGVAMPSRFSSDHSISDARSLAANLGIRFQVLSIQDVHQTFETALAPAFAGRTPDVTEENLQARIRGAMLMAFSNKFGHVLLTTGNKSELATGYCTIYGDMCGGLAVISDVPKTTIYELAYWINGKANRELIPAGSISKPPSAELRPNQTDQDSLPAYVVLDAILLRYVEQEQSAAQIIAQGYDEATVLRVIRLVDNSEYKRRQAAPGLKVTTRAFGSGRRMPIAQRYQQQPPPHKT